MNISNSTPQEASPIIDVARDVIQGIVGSCNDFLNYGHYGIDLAIETIESNLSVLDEGVQSQKQDLPEHALNVMMDIVIITLEAKNNALNQPTDGQFIREILAKAESIKL